MTLLTIQVEQLPVTVQQHLRALIREAVQVLLFPAEQVFSSQILICLVQLFHTQTELFKLEEVLQAK